MPPKKPDHKRDRRLVHSPKGGAPIIPGNPGNSGGKKGRSGRKPDEFKALMRELASGEKTIEAVRAILENPAHPQFVAAIKWASEQGYGKPSQAVEVSGKDGGPIGVTVRWGGVEIPL